jgi:hypothetical protein
MKITATTRAAKPGISPVCLPLVRVCRGELVQCLRRNRMTSTMITMITMAPKPINMRYSFHHPRIS